MKKILNHGIYVTVRTPSALKGEAAAAGEEAKIKHYTDKYNLEGIHLVPFAVEAAGRFGEHAKEYLKQLALGVDPTHSVQGIEYARAIAKFNAYVSHAIAVQTAAAICYYVEQVKKVTGSTVLSNTSHTAEPAQ